MATATRKSRAAKQLADRAADANVPASMEFLIREDNSGAYHWTIRADDGAILGRSDGFASFEEAEQAARHVLEGVPSARFEARTADAVPVDLTARRDALSDNSDPERWLDESGSFSNER